MINLVETLLNNNVFLFIVGCGLTLVPTMGIIYVHSKKP
jgi:hypothetical protein